MKKKTMQLHTGIVLRNFSPRKNKLALIDDRLGRIDGAFFAGTVYTGALLSYQVNGTPGRYLVDQFNMLDVPLSLARQDILFLHHVLELCYYFIPIGSCIQGIFNLLQLLYAAESVHWDITTKQFFLFRLFSQLGMHPEGYRLPASLLEQLHAQSFASAQEIRLADADKKILRTWLQHCLMQHPDVAQFNTVHFLNYE
jgi:hypothetical protein